MAEMELHLRQVGPSTSETRIREHIVLVDRPLPKGGTDAGPMGGEYFLASVGGCFMSTLLAAIKTRGADVSNVQTHVIGTLAESPTRYTSVELEVSGEYTDADLFARLVEIAENGCIMVQTLKRGIDFGVRIGAPA
jgi:putative redox protein